MSNALGRILYEKCLETSEVLSPLKINYHLTIKSNHVFSVTNFTQEDIPHLWFS